MICKLNEIYAKKSQMMSTGVKTFFSSKNYCPKLLLGLVLSNIRKKKFVKILHFYHLLRFCTNAENGAYDQKINAVQQELFSLSGINL